MKKKIALVVLYVVALCIAVPVSSYVFIHKKHFEPPNGIFVSFEFEENSPASIKSGEKILKGFRAHNAEFEDKGSGWSFNFNGVNHDAYPDYYAGQYINADGELVVMLTKEYKDRWIFTSKRSREVREEIMTLAQTDDIYFTTAKYSLKELTKTTEHIIKFFKSDPNTNDSFNFCGVEINERKNSVIVGVYPLSKETEKWFRQNVSDKPFISLQDRTYRYMP